jgi:Domain of unknown function (DUF4249)
MSKSSIVVVLLVLLSSCEKVVELNFRTNRNRLVVNGLVIDKPGPYVISLRYTTPYTFTSTEDGVKNVQGATVTIGDDLGNVYNLTEAGQPGNYHTDSASFLAEAGRSYHVNIKTPDGTQYTSIPEKLLPVTSIDSIYYTFDPNYGEIGRYEIYIDMHDPVGKGNNYRWRYFVDRYLLLDVDVDNDIFYDGKAIHGRKIGGWTSPQDSSVLRVEQMSLSKEAYLFWKNVRTEYDPQNNVPYDLPPAPLTGNVYNVNDPDEYALGYFGASGISIATVLARTK